MQEYPFNMPPPAIEPPEKMPLWKKILIGLGIYIGISAFVAIMLNLNSSSASKISEIKQQDSTINERNVKPNSRITISEFKIRWNALVRAEGQNVLKLKNPSDNELNFGMITSYSMIKEFGNSVKNDDGTMDLVPIEFDGRSLVGVVSVDHNSEKIVSVVTKLPNAQDGGEKATTLSIIALKIFTTNLLSVFEVELNREPFNEASKLFEELIENTGKSIQKNYHSAFGNCKIILGLSIVEIKLLDDTSRERDQSSSFRIQNDPALPRTKQDEEKTAPPSTTPEFQPAAKTTVVAQPTQPKSSSTNGDAATTGASGAAMTTYLASDRELNVVYKALAYRMDGARRLDLKLQQRAWLNMRKITCGASPDDNPAEAPSEALLRCWTRQNTERTEELRKILPDAH